MTTEVSPAIGGAAPVDTPPSVRIATTAAGAPDVQVWTAAAGWTSIHAADRLRDEAREQLEAALRGQPLPPIVALIGVGLGAIVEELEARRPDVRIVAVELLPGLLAACRAHCDWSTRDRKGRLVFASDPSQSLPAPAWPHAAIAEKPLAIVHPMLARQFPAQYEAARAALKQFFYEQRANAEARRRLAGPFLQHTLENLRAYDATTDVSALDGIANGDPVVLIGAGPSLDRLLPQLAAHRAKAWYVATDTALKPLLWAGIVPDLVVSIDPTTLNGRHLINLPTRSRPYLVGDLSLDPRAVNAFEGRIFRCRINRADPWPWLEPLGADATRLQVWGSVLTASVDLLGRMGAGTCLFAGMDLAYTNNQPYCRNTSFEDDWVLQRERDQLASIEAVWETRIAEVAIADTDVDGAAARTAPQMVAFRNWVRANAARGALTAVNVTGAGILHGPGIAQSSLDAALPSSAMSSSPASRLAAAARRRSKPIATRLAGAMARALETDAAGMPWAAWQESIPGFNASATRLALQHTERRLRAGGRKGLPMAKRESDWIDVPYDPGDFLAKAPLHWKVSQAGVSTYAYRIDGKTMTLSFKIIRSALTGGPAKELFIKIPGNYLPHRTMANTVWMRTISQAECGYATVHPGLDRVVVLRATEDYFPTEPTSFFLFGQLTFEVQ